MAHQVAGRDCDTCRDFVHDDRGLIEMQFEWDADKKQQVERPVRRLRRDDVDCERKRTGRQKIGCPKGHWRRPRDFGPREMLTYQRYLLCKDTGLWPRDGLFLWCVQIIAVAEREARDHLERIRHEQLLTVLGVHKAREGAFGGDAT